jgi:uncharacterized alpha-E superfamily protein
MLSRVADSIFWMSRMVERAENVARFIDVNSHLMLDLPADQGEQWEPLVITSGDHEDFKKRHGKATQESVTRFLTFDRANPNSILSCVHTARDNARSVRDVISSEMWESLNRFYFLVRDASEDPAMSDFYGFYQQVKNASHMFCGLTDNTLSHSEAWQWARMARMMERADKTSRILDVKYYILLPHVQDVGTPYDNIQWAALLKSASALEMYRKRYQRIMPDKVLTFLILDPEFPRAIRYCLNEASEAMRAITHSGHGSFKNGAEQLLGRLRADLNYAQASDIIDGGVHEYLDTFQLKLNNVGGAVIGNFFQARAYEAR